MCKKAGMSVLTFKTIIVIEAVVPLNDSFSIKGCMSMNQDGVHVELVELLQCARQPEIRVMDVFWDWILTYTRGKSHLTA